MMKNAPFIIVAWKLIITTAGQRHRTKGASMSTGREMKAEEDLKRTDAPKCVCCGHKVKSAAEGVGSGRTVLCTSCYETLLNPFPKLCCAVS
jgi:hypothetical protein